MKTKVGILVVILLCLFIAVPLLSLFLASDILGSQINEASSLAFWNDAYLRQIIYFSLWQATLSTVLSVGLGVIVARAFARYGDFPFRNLILSLFGLPLVVPAIVAVLGIISVYGSNGWLPLGNNLYGLNGILLAHLFFNLPLSVRLLLPVWASIPEQHWRISSQLGMNKFHLWKHLEWPALREALPGVSLLVFMLCLTSFAVVLSLGGGPKSTTLEVAIYQSLRFDFDPAQAVVLALLQLGISILLAVVAAKLSYQPDVEANLQLNQDIPTSSERPLLLLFIVIATLFIASPLFAMVIDALQGPLTNVLSDRKLWAATGFSLLIGLSAGLISITVGWLILSASAEQSYRGNKRLAHLLEFSGSVIYVVPPLVVGTGLFILLSKITNIFEWTIGLVILINGLIGLPFVIRTLGPAMRQHTAKYERLCTSLKLSAWQRFKQIDLPLLRKPVGLSMSLVTAMSMGDLGVIALFGSPETATLPLLLYHRLSAYQIPHATVTAVFLLSICLLTFWLIERYIGGKSSSIKKSEQEEINHA